MANYSSDRSVALHTRKNDISLMITQNNNLREVIIDDALGSEERVRAITGYNREELQGKSLISLLPQRIAESVEEYVEYDIGGNDISDVFKKTRNFAFLKPDNTTVMLSMRIQTGVMGQHPQFILVVGVSDSETDAVIKSLLELRNVETIDSLVGITDRTSFFQQGQLLEEYVQQDRIIAAIAVLRVDGGEVLESQEGVQAYGAILREVAARCRNNFRGSDIFGYMGDGYFAALLLKADEEQVRVPLNRLRASLHARPISASDGGAITLSMAYKQLNQFDEVESTILDAHATLRQTHHEINQLVIL